MIVNTKLFSIHFRIIRLARIHLLSILHTCHGILRKIPFILKSPYSYDFKFKILHFNIQKKKNHTTHLIDIQLFIQREIKIRTIRASCFFSIINMFNIILVRVNRRRKGFIKSS